MLTTHLVLLSFLNGASGAAAQRPQFYPQIVPPSPYLPDEKIHRRQLAESIRLIYRGKGPTPYHQFTLATSKTSTTLKDERISYYSHLTFMPQTANAAAILSSIYVDQTTQVPGQAVVTHSSTTHSDCIFRVMIWG